MKEIAFQCQPLITFIASIPADNLIILTFWWFVNWFSLTVDGHIMIPHEKVVNDNNDGGMYISNFKMGKMVMMRAYTSTCKDGDTKLGGGRWWLWKLVLPLSKWEQGVLTPHCTGNSSTITLTVKIVEDGDDDDDWGLYFYLVNGGKWYHKM